MEGQDIKSTGNKLRVLFFEFLGVAGLMFTINISLGNAVSIGFYITCAAIICGGISGGHFNGAVSLAVFIKEKNYGKNIVMLLLFLVAQWVGAFFGVFLSWMAMADKNNSTVARVPENIIPHPCPYQGCETEKRYSEVITIEFVCTFIMVLTILCIKGETTTPTKIPFLKCLGVGLAHVAMISTAAAESGGGVNPSIIPVLRFYLAM